MTEGIGNQKNNQDQADYNIAESGWNTEKSSENLRGLTVTHSPLKDYLLTSGGIIIIVITIIIIITYTCYSVTYYQFSLLYNSPWWHYFVLLLREIQFLPSGFTLLAISTSSGAQTVQFIAWSIHTVVRLPISLI